MKYTFESSETEVTELYSLIGLIAREVGKTVRHANELRAARRPRILAKAKEVVSEDAADDDEGADVIDFPRPAPTPVRVSEEELEESIVNEPEPYPTPAPTETPEEAKRRKAIMKGSAAFLTLIQDWLVGIDPSTMQLIEGVVQPDRAQMLRDLQNGPNGYGVLLYVKACGGLQCAIAQVTGSQELALALAPYIVPPASIAFSELADTYEYTNPFRKDED